MNTQFLAHNLFTISKRQQIILRLTTILTALALLVSIIPASGGTTSPAIPRGTYSNFFLPNVAGTGVTKVTYGITIEYGPLNTNYFYSNQFGIVDGDGGYIGLQQKGSRVNGSTGPTAVFSIFNAGIQAVPSQNCSVEQPHQNFDGYIGSSGTSCRIAFDVQQNHKYVLTVEKTTSDTTGTFWRGTIVDKTTNVTTVIADIKVPPVWKTLKAWTSSWTEYFGALPATCEALPYSRVKFEQPLANNTIPASFGDNRLSTGGTCNNANSYTYNGSYIQEMGTARINPEPPVVTQPPVTQPPITQPPVTTPATGTRPPVTQPPVTQPPVTVPPTYSIVAPSSLSSYNTGCFLFWCAINVSWKNTSTKQVSYVVTAGDRAPVRVNTTSYIVPWVLIGTTNPVSIYAIDSLGNRSAISTFYIKA